LGGQLFVSVNIKIETMASITETSITITNAPTWTEKANVEKVFAGLGVGTVIRVDEVLGESQGRECKKFFIHFEPGTMDSGLREKLMGNQAKQREGEMLPPVKIVYGTTRDGRDMYWQIYACPTPADRTAARAAKTGEFKVRIEM
jgi:hypothetical protein